MIISKVSFLSEKFVFLQAYLKVVQLSIFMDVEVAFCQSGYSLALSVALFLERAVASAAVLFSARVQSCDSLITDACLEPPNQNNNTVFIVNRGRKMVT